MSNTNSHQYCTYLTIYKGNKLPMFYIGYSTVKKIEENNYRGSVSSKEYKDIWKQELKENPHLFKTIILTKHLSKEDAILKECAFHKYFEVNKNSMYINMSISNEKFTKTAPFYHTEKTKKKISISGKGKNKGDMNPAKKLESRKKISEEHKGRKFIIKEDKMLKVKQKDIDYYISNGWKLKSPEKIKIYDEENLVNKIILIEELQLYLNLGWKVGSCVSKETREKLSKSSKNRIMTEETKRKISENRDRSKKISSALKGKPKTKEHTENAIKARMIKGCSHTEETKRKISEKCKNKIWINNGIRNTTISINQEIPHGYTKGIINNPFRSHIKLSQ